MNDLSWLVYTLLAWLLVMSVILFCVMGHDKHLAGTRRRRVPERTLFVLAVVGGALGGVLGMQIFRHKTQKPKFFIWFPLLALAQWGLVIWQLLPADRIG